MNMFKTACVVGLVLAGCSRETRPAEAPPSNPDQQNPVPPAGPAPAAPSPNSEPNMPSPESQPPDKAPTPSSFFERAPERVNAGNAIAAPSVWPSQADLDLLLVPSNRLEDFRINEQLRRELGRDEILSQAARHVEIHTVDGVVTLHGVVRTLAERAAIIAAAKRIAGPDHVGAWIEIRR